MRCIMASPLDPKRRSRPVSRSRRLEAMEDRLLLATFPVTSTADSGNGSLRQAILSAESTPGADTISFSIGSGPQTIRLSSPLPQINDSVTIDGTTQPGYAGTPLIELNGSTAGAGANGLTISAGNSTVRGLAIRGFAGSGIVLDTNGGDVIQGNFIGTNAAGTVLANGGSGVLISGVGNNTVGGTTAAARNVISGNSGAGVTITGAAAIG